MARNLKHLTREALDLPEEERATLAGILIESLEAASAEPEVEEAWLAEAERRWQQIESGEVETVPWEEVRARLFTKR